MEKEWKGPWACKGSSSYILDSSKFKVYNTSTRVLLFDVINKKPHPNNTFCIDSAHDHKTNEYEAVAKLCQLLLLNLVFYALLVLKFSCGIWASSIQDDSDQAWRNLKVVLELYVFMGIYWHTEV